VRLDSRMNVSPSFPANQAAAPILKPTSAPTPIGPRRPEPPIGHPIASPTDPTSRLVSILEAKGYGPHPTGPDTWDSRCPGHDGPALIHCQHEPSCSADAIVRVLGLALSDLFPSKGRNSHASGNGKPKKPAKGKSKGWVDLQDAVRWYGKKNEIAPQRHQVYL